jgi:two-component system, LytTR family, response regulator
MQNPKRKIRSVVIEDERRARETLVKLLTKYCHEVEVVGESDSVNGAIEIIKQTKPELVFLDIELIGGTGFDVLEHLKPYDFSIVFTTAYEKYGEKTKQYSNSVMMFKPLGIEDVINQVKRII